jgi:hypothetical protein
MARAARDRWFSIGKQLVYEKYENPSPFLLRYLKALQETFEACDSEGADVAAAIGTVQARG